jgi:competence CoiA-like predicted nuclease
MQLKNFKKIDNGGVLKAVFAIVENNGRETDCQYYETDVGQNWVIYAGKEYINKDGKKRNFSQVRYPKEYQTEVDNKVKELVKPLLNMEPMKQFKSWNNNNETSQILGRDDEIPF